MYAGDPNAAPGPLQRRIVEATPPKVKESTITMFKGESGHLYLGPRRPINGLSPSERTGLVDFVNRQMGYGYALTGEGQITQGREYSCVGLVEKALDSQGKGVLTDFQQATASTPLEMFRATIAVGDITADVGEALDIAVYRVVVDPKSPYRFLTFEGWYTDGGTSGFELYEIQAVTNLDKATFSGSANTREKYHFRWTLEAKDAGKTFPVRFLLTGDVYGSSLFGGQGPSRRGEDRRNAEHTHSGATYSGGLQPGGLFHHVPGVIHQPFRGTGPIHMVRARLRHDDGLGGTHRRLLGQGDVHLGSSTPAVRPDHRARPRAYQTGRAVLISRGHVHLPGRFQRRGASP